MVVPCQFLNIAKSTMADFGHLLRYCLASIVTDDFYSISKCQIYHFSSMEYDKSQKFLKF